MTDGTKASSPHWIRRPAATATGTLIVAALTMVPAGPAAADQPIGFPTFSGSSEPVPATGVDYTTGSMMKAIFDRDLAQGAGSDTDHDFWMDRMLVRTGTAGDSDPGNSDGNRWMFSRGRAAFMKTHDPGVLGFGGELAYVESTGRSGYAITAVDSTGPIQLTEDTAARKQTPSYWRAKFANTGAGLSVVETKYITDLNVAVTQLAITNTGSSDRELTLVATSPYAATTEGSELIGAVRAFNDLTTIRARFSGDGFAPQAGELRSTITIPAGDTVGTKVQLGLVTPEASGSRTQYDEVRDSTPAAAYTDHVVRYNRWWADNVPYIDLPEDNIDKTIYYRWWLMRFNFLDANIPGNDYQFPTAVEGALGYNNAIVLTSGMFIDDLKYLRNPSYAYGTWVSAGEVAKSGKYTDNPGDPANWSNSYTEYLTEAAWRSYELHGGPKPVAESLARYGENDVRDLLADFDSNNNDLIEYDWGAMTGNDADAVSFHWRPGAAMDRTESAYLYSNAKASAAAYRTAGMTAKADAMEALAEKVKQAVLDVLWDPDSKLLLHRIADGDKALVPWKEINNYYPFSVGLMPRPDGTAANDQYLEALRLWDDPAEYPIFPFYTANQKDKAEAAAAGEPGSNNFSVINSTVTFRFLSSVLRNYPSPYVSADAYKKLLYWNAWAHYQSGDNRYPDQNEFWADGSADPQKIGYRSWIHHTILGATNFTAIEDVAGLRPRDDAKIELSPIDIGWDHFTVNNVRYRDRDLTITWDKPGDGIRHYGDVPEGYSIYLDGKLALTVDSLTKVVFDPNTGQVDLPSGGQVVTAVQSSLEAPSQVSFGADSRVVDIFAKAGKDIRPADGDPADLAQGATATATFAASGRPASAAVDGATVNEPFWGTAGSPDPSDNIDIDLGSAKTFDDIRVHFYRSSTTATVAGYAEPALYELYYDDNGTWRRIPGQLRSPTVPRANLNEAQFAPVTAQRIRVTVRHQPGVKTGVKEVVVHSTGGQVTAPGNQAPSVDAYLDTSTTPKPGSASIIGTAKDDALPSGTLSSSWSVVSAPADATAIFDNPSRPTTSVSFTRPGTYVLRLTATDGELTSHTDLAVDGTVPSSGEANVAPFATPTADYTAGWNNINAVNDGTALNTGGAQAELWGTWSGSRPATRWLQYTWPSPVRVTASDITFWHDSPRGTGDGVAVPKSWTLQYLAEDGTTWVDVPNPSELGVAESGSNPTTFGAVRTTALRATFTADSNGTTNSAVAVSEWRVLAEPPESTTPVHVPTTAGVVPQLPATVEQVFSDGTRTQTPVKWPEVTAEQVSQPGSEVRIDGIVEGGGLARATIWVRVTNAVQINTIDPVAVHTIAGVAPQLPTTVTAVYNDGSKDSRIPVSWDPVDPSSYAAPGTFDLTGAVAGTDKRATATVTVREPDLGPDTTKPTLSVQTDPAAPNGENGWYVTVPQVAVTAQDDRDPAPLVEASVDGADWAILSGPVSPVGDGVHTLSARATDAAGNRATAPELTLWVDTTEPVSNAVVDQAARTVTLRGADATSRLDHLEYRTSGGSWTLYDGPVTVGKAETTIDYAAIDRAGNRETTNTVVVAAAADPAKPTTTDLRLSPSRVPAGKTVMATVTVTGTAATPTGMVVVTDGALELARGELVAGEALIRVPTSALRPGVHTITATYAGDEANLSSVDRGELTVVKAASRSTLSVSPSTVRKGTRAHAVISVDTGSVAPGGYVSVLVDGRRVARVLVGEDRIRITLPRLPVGRHRVTVRYSGTAQVEASRATRRVTVVRHRAR